jgi:hypothetical protein
MDCFGSYKKSCTDACEFKESCKFATEDERKTRIEDNKWKIKSSQLIDIEQSGKCSYDIDKPETKERTYTQSEVIELMRVMMEIRDDEKLRMIVSERFKGIYETSKISKNIGLPERRTAEHIGKALHSIFSLKVRKISNNRFMKLTSRQFDILKMKEVHNYQDSKISNLLCITHDKLKAELEAIEEIFTK